MEKNWSVKKARIAIVVLIIVQIIIGVIGKNIPTIESGELSWWENNWCHWFCYRFPLASIIHGN